MQAPQRLYPSLNTLSGRYSPTSAYRHRMQPFQSNSIFGSFEDPLFQARAAQAALENMDVKNVNLTNVMRPEMFSNYLMTSDQSHLYQGIPGSSASDFDPSLLVPTSSEQPVTSETMTSLQQVDPSKDVKMDPYSYVMAMQHYGAPSQFPQYPMPATFAAASAAVSGSSTAPSSAVRYPITAAPTEVDTDPRELERFAEHFKQRRIKLGVTQADVGKALAHLKMPGVGSLSQSTICRFESLTLSHNNMVALKPILHSWLDKAEEAMKQKDTIGDTSGILPNTDKKRKRTSIAAPEKRLLEDYFRQQPRPSGERIAAIADKLDLKKNVVRVWFCNQRQKQKRNGVPSGGPAGTAAVTARIMGSAQAAAQAAAQASKCAVPFSTGGYFE